MTTTIRIGARALAAVVVAWAVAGQALAAPILCNNPAANHMLMDDSQATACLAAGLGNINGNPANDPFLLGGGTGAGYSLASKDDAANPFNIATTQTGNTGTWSIDPSFWFNHAVGAIAFKFGTGNQPDEWFVFQLVQGVTSGTWTFVNTFGTGGGLSHTNLYGAGDPVIDVSEPGIVLLLLVGLAGIVAGRRRRG